MAGKATLIRRLFECLVLMLCALVLSGGLIPVPHHRLHEFGVTGRLLDAETHPPISAAGIEAADDPEKITFSDVNGSFDLKPVYGWHGAFFFGPICLSLWPGF